MKRRDLLAAAGIAPAAALAQSPSRIGRKTLRLPIPTPETTLDTVQTNSDLRTSEILAHIFEAPLTYDYLARPARLALATAAAMPEVSADGKVFTIRIQPGILFADDPAFNGKRARADRSRLRLQPEALLRPEVQLERPLQLRAAEAAGFVGAARPRGQGAHAVRLRGAGRRRSRDRQVHLPHHARRAEPALHLHAGRSGVLRRGGARGRRALWRRNRRAPGGHRGVPPEELAPRLAHRARTLARLSRRAVRGRAGRRAAGAGDRRARSRARPCRWSTRS